MVVALQQKSDDVEIDAVNFYDHCGGRPPTPPQLGETPKPPLRGYMRIRLPHHLSIGGDAQRNPRKPRVMYLKKLVQQCAGNNNSFLRFKKCHFSSLAS